VQPLPHVTARPQHPLHPLTVSTSQQLQHVPSYDFPYSTYVAVLRNNFPSKGSQKQQTSQLASVPPGSLVLHCPFDQQGGTAKVELPFEMRQQVLSWWRSDGSKLVQSLVHSMKDISQHTGSTPLPSHDIHQPVQAGQVDTVEVSGTLMPILDLIVLRHLHHAGVPLSAGWPGLPQLHLTAVLPPLADPASPLVQGHQPHPELDISWSGLELL